MAGLFRCRVFCFLGALVLLAPATARADDWTVTTADFRNQSVLLRGIGPDGVRVADTASGPVRTIKFDQFVSAKRFAPLPATPPAFTLALVGGDRLTGNPTALNGENLVWQNPLLGSIPVSLDYLVALGRFPALSFPNKPPEQDVVTLSNGDTVAGIFSDLAGGKVKVQVNNQMTEVPLADVARIFFATPPGSTVSAGKFRVRLADRSVLTVTELSLDNDKFKLTLPGKAAKVLTISANDVTGVELLNGPVQWLSSMVPTEAVQTPYLAHAPVWPATFDSAVDGSPMSFDGRTADHGVGVHSYSRLVFAVDPRWKYFRTQFAIDSRRDNPRTLADVTVRIKLDDKVVLEQSHVHVGPPGAPAVIDIGDAKTITLECDYGPFGDTQGHLDWIEPALTVVKPLPPVAPATQPAAIGPATTMPESATTVPTAPATAPANLLPPVSASMPATKPRD
jgi:hypothetical protein